MSYMAVRRALVAAGAANPPGRYASVADIMRADPSLKADDIVAELGAMHDHGEATTVGFGNDRTARYDGAVIVLADGSAFPVIWTSNRRALSAGRDEIGIVDLERIAIDLPEQGADW